MLKDSRTATKSQINNLLTILLIVSISTVIYLLFSTSVPGKNDPTGYLYASRQIASTGSPSLYSPLNAAFGPYFSINAFHVQRPNDDTFYLGLHHGYAYLLALAWLLTPGGHLPLLVTGIISGLFSGLLYLLCQEISLPKHYSVLAVIFFCFAPAVLQASTETLTDVPCTFFLYLGVILLIRGIRKRSSIQLFVANISLLYAGFIRYNLFLTVICIWIWAFTSLLSSGPKKHTHLLVVSFIISGFLGVAGIAFHNWYYFGLPWKSGYDVSLGWIPWPPFSLNYALGKSPLGGYNLAVLLRTLVYQFSPIIIIALVGAILFLRTNHTYGLLFLALAFTQIVPYIFYLWPPNQSNARFLIPAFPIICIWMCYAFSEGVRLVTRNSTKLELITCVLCVAFYLISQGPRTYGALNDINNRNKSRLLSTISAMTWMKTLPPESILISHDWGDTARYYMNIENIRIWQLLVIDKETSDYDAAQSKKNLINIVKRLIVSGKSVYIYQDQSLPPQYSWFNPFVIIRETYKLTRTSENPSLYIATLR